MCCWVCGANGGSDYGGSNDSAKRSARAKARKRAARQDQWRRGASDCTRPGLELAHMNPHVRGITPKARDTSGSWINTSLSKFHALQRQKVIHSAQLRKDPMERDLWRLSAAECIDLLHSGEVRATGAGLAFACCYACAPGSLAAAGAHLRLPPMRSSPVGAPGNVRPSP